MLLNNWFKLSSIDALALITMPHHSATPSRRTRTKLRMRKCSRARSPITQALNYQFNANGALTSDGLRRYEFDAANRLAAMTTGAVDTSPTTRYVHNALGQRLFKTEPQFPPAAGDENDPAFMASLIAFFSNLWGGNTGAANPSASEKLGFQYFYDEDGSLLYELGSGGANSTGSAHYVYLPTPSGPMPVAFYNGSKHYAVQTDHLNTPRRLTQSDKKVAWQWAFSAFGDEQPTTGKNRYVDPATTPNAGSTTVADVTFNLRYPGQYFDKESGLSYNYFRSYDARTGRYTQADPIDLAGGWNKFVYVDGNPLSWTDPLGLTKAVCIAVNSSGSSEGYSGGRKVCEYSCTANGQTFNVNGGCNKIQDESICYGIPITGTTTNGRGQIRIHTGDLTKFNVDTDSTWQKYITFDPRLFNEIDSKVKTQKGK
jgi:RHS repeat-associated protein